MKSVHKRKAFYHYRLTACVCAKSLQLCPTLRLYGLWPLGLLCPWDSPGKNTGVGCPRVLEWGAIVFSDILMKVKVKVKGK